MTSDSATDREAPRPVWEALSSLFLDTDTTDCSDEDS
jgi:hypothetical protein